MRKSKRPLRIAVLALLFVPALYLVAALVGSLVPVNRGWSEPERGITIYLASNGIHSDLILPVSAQGLNWKPLIPVADFRAADPSARWIAFGSGEEHVYLDTPRWRDIRPRTIWSGLTGGKRLMHVEYVQDPSYAVREIRLRPEEYRRLWSAIRSDFAADEKRRPIHVAASGYHRTDTFYRATGKASAIRTCNSWTADRLRLAGVRTSLWPPFVQGLEWRYRQVEVRGTPARSSRAKSKGAGPMVVQTALRLRATRFAQDERRGWH